MEMAKKKMVVVVVMVMVAAMAMARIEGEAAASSASAEAAAASSASTGECQTYITTLVPCLSYVQGQAELPSQACCSAVLPIHRSAPQCLCELVLAAADHSPNMPSLNVSLSLALGPACNIDTDPTRCPRLLNLAPGSSDAKIFPTAPATNSGSTPSTPSTMTPSAPSAPTTTGSSGEMKPPSLGQASQAAAAALGPSLVLVAAFLALITV